MNRKLIIATLAWAWMSLAQAAGPLYDINEFSLTSVRLGMTADEARGALAKHYKVKPSEIYANNESRPTKLMSHAPRAKTEGMSSVVVLSDTNPPRVYSVITRLPKRMTAEDWVGTIESTVKRYGTPTIRRSGPGSKEVALWCDKSTAKDVIKRGFMCDHDGEFGLRYSTSPMDLTAITLTSNKLVRQFEAQSKPTKAGKAFDY